MTSLTESELAAKAQPIKLLLLDVDGVLTDGRLYFGNQGEELKAFNILDGHGIKMLQASGVTVGIVTGRESQLVQRRATDLGIELIIQGSRDKQADVAEIARQRQLPTEAIAFMGDDYPDLPAMSLAGLWLAPANAHREIARRAHWQSQFRGGEGAVREACDMIMQHQGSYENALQQFLRP